MTERPFLRWLPAVSAAGLPSAVRTECDIGRSCSGIVTSRHLPRAAWGLALIATRNFMPFARLTAHSFRAVHPEFHAFLLLVDGDEGDAAMFPEGHVVLLDDLDVADIGWHVAKFTAAELSNALKPAFLRYLAGCADTIIYSDCDIAFFSQLTEMLDAVATHDLVLIPHMLTPPPRPEQFGMRPTRADTFNAGLINAGCFAIRPARCEQFITLWEQMNFAPGAFFEGAGYQTDQQHLNWALVAMRGVYIVRDSRYNVAYWNLHERNLRVGAGPDRALQGGETRFQVDQRPLGFFHFSGYDVFDRLRTSRHDGRHSVFNLPAVAEILNWYSDEVLACPTARMI